MLALLAGSSRLSAADAQPEGAFDDDPRPPTPLEIAVVAAGKDPAKLEELERELLAILQSPGAPPERTQEAAQHLGYILLAQQQQEQQPKKQKMKEPSPILAALAPMLVDDARVDLARLALDRVPGAAVDALYIDALKKARGRARLALVPSAGQRAIIGAIPMLASFLTAEDEAVRVAATTALGQIGGTEAHAALAYAKTPLAPEVLNARLAAATKAGSTASREAAREIFQHQTAPLPQRAAALRLWLTAESNKAAELINEALASSEPLFQQVAIAAVPELRSRGDVARVAELLPKLPASVQIPLLAALAQVQHTQPVKTAAAAMLLGSTTDPTVRLAVIDTMGNLRGGGAGAEILSRLAAGSGSEAKAAFAALSRLSYPGADKEIRAGAAKGDPKLRAVFIQQLGARNMTEDLPFLFRLRSAPESEVRLAALDALREIAPPAQQQAIIDWALRAESKTEQARAMRALITIILRDDAADTRAGPVIAALDSAAAPGRVTLMPVLSRIAGPQAFAAAGKFARDADEGVANAAVTELARWPEVAALAVLVDVAQTTSVASVRDAAIRGAAGFLARGEGVTADQRSAQARALLELPASAGEKNALLNVLSLCLDAAALETAKRFLDDSATAEMARDAVDALTSTLAGPPEFKASNGADELANLGDRKPETSWSVPNTPGEWLFADLRHSRPVRKITLDHGERGWGFPERVAVYVSDDPEQQGELRTEAEGERGKTIITLPAGVRGRYVWVRQTGARDPRWTMVEFLVE